MKVRNINISKYLTSNISYNAYSDTKRGNRGNIVNFCGIAKVQNGLKWVANNFSSPHQRAILGITALCTQPFIDLHNKHIKKEDKPITVSKTIAKIIAGTLVGILMRYYAIKAVKNFTKTVDCGKYSQILLPKGIISKLKADINSVPEKYLLNYRNGLGTALGLAGCLFTNFAVDAPLSKILTNIIYDNFLKKENVNEY